MGEGVRFRKVRLTTVDECYLDIGANGIGSELFTVGDVINIDLLVLREYCLFGADRLR